MLGGSSGADFFLVPVFVGVRRSAGGGGLVSFLVMILELALSGWALGRLSLLRGILFNLS